ncbi:MAG TPA: ATP-binding cassette domain-containing protein, partial [Acidimicrobiales bacterium]
MALAVETRELARSYGKVRALAGVDLAVEEGSVLGMLGPNGAGKTTLVRILATLLRPDAGTASVCGHDVVERPDAVRAQIGLTGQFAAVDEDLTGRENLVLVGRLGQLTSRAARARAGELLERFGLADAADRRATTYSGGMARRLDLAASLVTRPRVVFLDEPTTGLDPASRRALWEAIRGLVAEGTTVFLTSQYLEEVDALAERIVVVDRGSVIAAGTGAELKQQVGGEVLELCLGSAGDVGAAARALDGMADGRVEVRTDPGAGTVSVAVGEQRSLIAQAIRRLDDAGIAVEDVSVTRPTLDDVFFALTGQAPEARGEGADAAAGGDGAGPGDPAGRDD